MQAIDMSQMVVNDTSAIDRWTQLLKTSVQMHASDIHLTYHADGLHIGLRIDGQIIEQGRVNDIEAAHKLTNHIKIIGGLDVGDHRRPQNGRAMAKIEDRGIDLRVSLLPTVYGQDIVVRVLDRTVSLLQLDQLGLSRRELNRLLGMISAPNGLVLVTGPTGAGKTTTLYAILNRLIDGTRKIITIEDPVEYDLGGISQSQVNRRLDIDYALLLQTVLQQDPNVIMIGELRDTETVATAIRAAATGHLVFATMHSLGAPEAVESLISLGAHPHFVSRALRGVIAQNLVRRVCPTCAQRIDETESVLPLDDVRELLNPEHTPALSIGKGCPDCHMTGYKGRIGLFEIMVNDGEIKSLIETRRPTHEIRRAAARTGMLTMQQSGKIAAFQGHTTVEELIRTIPVHIDDDAPGID